MSWRNKLIFTLEDLSKYIELNTEEIEKDELLLKSSYEEIENLLEYSLESKIYKELQTIIDYKIILNSLYIEEIMKITDMNTGKEIEHCVVDYKNKTVIMISPAVNNHVVLVEYKAGFTEETLPEVIKEALIRIFLFKKNQMNKSINIEEIEADIPEEIKQTLYPYSKKRL